MNDFLVGGSDENKHNESLRKFLTVMSANEVTLNSEKCTFHQNQVEFLGYSISSRGIKPLNENVEAIEQSATPTNIMELHYFLSMDEQLS